MPYTCLCPKVIILQLDGGKRETKIEILTPSLSIVFIFLLFSSPFPVGHQSRLWYIQTRGIIGKIYLKISRLWLCISKVV